MTPAEALALAQDWIAAWNAHDLPRILAHYSEDFEMSSPHIPQLAEPSGTLKGKARVGDYWAKALARYPQLRFELETVLLGVNSLALYYRSSVANRPVVEILTLDAAGRIIRGHAHNSIGPA